MVSPGASARRGQDIWRDQGLAEFKAWRSWSVSDPALHVASYEFADQAALDRGVSGEALKRLVADFDRAWPDVTRTREILVLAEEYGAM